MIDAHFQLNASDNSRVFCYLWEPETIPIAIVQIAHGMGEHANRYQPVAEKLTQAGYVVVANDHRGHGRTSTSLGDFGVDGWNRMIKDLFEINQAMKDKYPDLPLILLGHSMGALLVQQYMSSYADSMSGIVLSGSPGFAPRTQLWLAYIIATYEKWRHGALNTSEKLESMIFGQANAAFESSTSHPTGFEWLSRDSAEVKKYLDDSYCGFVPCSRSLRDMFRGRRHTQRSHNLARLNRDIPVYVFSGSADPVHAHLQGIELMLKEYRERGLLIETQFYQEGRHEMLNEINKDEVIDDLVNWLDRYFAPTWGSSD